PRLPGWWKLALPLAAVVVFYAVHWYTLHRPDLSADWERGPWYLYNGADQLALRSEEHTSELQSRGHLVCRLLLEKKMAGEIGIFSTRSWVAHLFELVRSVQQLRQPQARRTKSLLQRLLWQHAVIVLRRAAFGGAV